MQTVAEIWVILSLTGSGVAVGVATALQFLPMLLLGAFGEADRRPGAQAAAAAVDPGSAHGGAPGDAGARPDRRADAVDRVRAGLRARLRQRGRLPTRQAFVMEIVGGEQVVSAVSLNSVLVHAARVVGPALAGVLIATVGPEPASPSTPQLRLHDRGPGEDGRGLAAPGGPCPAPARRRAGRPSLRPSDPRSLDPAGADGCRGHPRLQLPGDPAAAGPLQLRRRRQRLRGPGLRHGRRRHRRGARDGRARSGQPGAAGRRRDRVWGLSLLAAGAPTMALELVALAPLGAASVMLAASVNSSLQLASDPGMRGRVMALYAIVFLGSTPIGAPLAGYLSRRSTRARRWSWPGRGHRRGTAGPPRLRAGRFRSRSARRLGSRGAIGSVIWPSPDLRTNTDAKPDPASKPLPSDGRTGAGTARSTSSWFWRGCVIEGPSRRDASACVSGARSWGGSGPDREPAAKRMAAGLCNRPRQDGRGYVSGAYLGGMLRLQATGGALRQTPGTYVPEGSAGRPAQHSSPDPRSIGRGRGKGNTKIEVIQ